MEQNHSLSSMYSKNFELNYEQLNSQLQLLKAQRREEHADARLLTDLLNLKDLVDNRYAYSLEDQIDKHYRRILELTKQINGIEYMIKSFDKK